MAKEKKDDFDYAEQVERGKGSCARDVKTGDGVSRDVPVEGKRPQSVAGRETVIADFSIGEPAKGFTGSGASFLVCSPDTRACGAGMKRH